MPAPAASWNLVRVYGTWHGMDGSLKAGNYTVQYPNRVTSTTDDVIVPAGTFATGMLQTSNLSAPSLDVMIPATDDPSLAQTGLTATITVTFSDYSTVESYVITVPYANRPVASGGTGVGVDLRTVVLPQNIAPANPLYKVGVAGGLAQLNSAGKVINADGNVAGAVASLRAGFAVLVLTGVPIESLPLLRRLGLVEATAERVYAEQPQPDRGEHA